MALTYKKPSQFSAATIAALQSNLGVNLGGTTDLSSSYITIGKYVNYSTGLTPPSATYNSTGYVACVPGDIIYTILPANSIAGIAFFTSENVYISGLAGLQFGAKKVKIKVPANAAFFRTTKVAADSTFLVKYNSLSGAAAAMEQSASGEAFDLATELASKDEVFVPAGTHLITTTVDIPAGKRIYGVRGKSFLKASGGVLKVLSIVGVNDISIEGVSVQGEMANVLATDTSKVSNNSEALAENGAGTKYGIYIENALNIHVRNCEVRNFDYAGIYTKTIAPSNVRGLAITDCYLTNNYIGLKTADDTEYSIFKGLHINLNHIGLVNEGANNNFENCTITTNVFGVVIKNVGANTGHGVLSNSLINHNTICAIYVDSIDSGYLLSDNNVHYPTTNTIYIKGSSGVLVNGNNIYGLITVEDGGGNAIHSTVFRILASVVTLTGVTHVSLKNNIYIDGSDSAAINN